MFTDPRSPPLEFLDAAKENVLLLLSQFGTNGSVQAVMTAKVQDLLSSYFTPQGDGLGFQVAKLAEHKNDFLCDLIVLWQRRYDPCRNFVFEVFQYIVFRRGQLANLLAVPMQENISERLTPNAFETPIADGVLSVVKPIGRVYDYDSSSAR